MACVGLHRSKSRVCIVVVGGEGYHVMSDEVAAVLLQIVGGDDVCAGVRHGDAVWVSLSFGIPIANVGERSTERVLARASGRIKKFHKDDFAAKILEPHRRVFS